MNDKCVDVDLSVQLIILTHILLASKSSAVHPFFSQYKNIFILTLRFSAYLAYLPLYIIQVQLLL